MAPISTRALIQILPANGQPLYRRLLDGLRADLDRGRLRPGDLLPPEIEIARRHGISRHTVRQAIIELTREGWLKRERGRGTYVLKRRFTQALESFYSFVHDMGDRGLAHETRILHRAVRPAQTPVAERLELSPGAPVIEMELLCVVEGSPLMLEFSVTPYARFPALLRADLRQRSLYDVIAEQHGVIVTLGREEIRPVVLDRRQAALLDVPPGSPAFHVDREVLAKHEPIELRRSLIRGDRYLYRIELPAGPR
ncbi:MAG TPA: GntR family transcriptional regulator [Chloroflexota bacterium]|jgi:GntR family transcriptional regulator|nr:GntR family transcriptional regulator [Chloroflexota bacterium]